MKTMFYSEVLDQIFEKKDDCINAELNYKKKQRVYQEEKNALEAERQKLKEELDAVNKAYNHAKELEASYYEHSKEFKNKEVAFASKYASKRPKVTIYSL